MSKATEICNAADRRRTLAGVTGFFMAGILVIPLPGCQAAREEKATSTKVKDEENEDGRPRAKIEVTSGRESEGNTKFLELHLEKPFDKYLLANPLLMEIAGAKIIQHPGGKRTILSVASTALKNDSAEERLRAERVCRLKAIANVVAEKEGVRVWRFDELKERALLIVENGQEKGTSVSDLLQITRTKVEGIAKDMPVVGRWKSKEGDVFYLVIGATLDREGNPVREDVP